MNMASAFLRSLPQWTLEPLDLRGSISKYTQAGMMQYPRAGCHTGSPLPPEGLPWAPVLQESSLIDATTLRVVFPIGTHRLPLSMAFAAFLKTIGRVILMKEFCSASSTGSCNCPYQPCVYSFSSAQLGPPSSLGLSTWAYVINTKQNKTALSGMFHLFL